MSQENAESLKALGNQQFKSKQYPEAIATYTSIIDSPDGVSTSLLRLAHSNRAACYVETKEFIEAINDCLCILDVYPSSGPEDDDIMRKVHLRLARGYHMEGMLDQAEEELANFKKLFGETEAYTQLNNSVVQARNKINEGTFVPIKYIVKVQGQAASDAGDSVFFYDEFAPVEICDATHLTPQVAQFANDLVYKYYQEIMDKKEWKCWNCGKDAVAMLHTPSGRLQDKKQPSVFDWAQPICETGGECETKGTDFNHRQQNMKHMFTQ